MRLLELRCRPQSSGPWLALLGLTLCLALAPASGANDARESIPEVLPGAEPFSPELRAKLAAALAEATGRPRTRHLSASGAPVYTNRLLLERSPYLRQHAHNPVDWRPWGDAAFETARRLGRPVLVSIGYSTCHWCHVMEDESFDDPEVARFLNAHFVAVKVDREVRPDVDAIYMAAVVALTGQGGWPLNVFLTPDRKPFYGGTYFPRDDGRGRPGILSLLASISRAYGDEPAQVTRAAETLEQRIRLELAGKRPDASWLPGPGILHAAVRDIERRYDPEWGGLGTQPKFPSRPSVRLLLRYYRRTGEKSAFDMALGTLEHMAAGGIRDQLGGGFHRYATDRRWRVPHFEKMLYDNALLAVAYLEGWQVSGRPELREVCRETLEYLLREMTAEAGGFFSATDADSIGPDGESIEGAYFTWTRAEVRGALPPALAELAVRALGVEHAGPVEGRSVLHRPLARDTLAGELGFTPTALKGQLDQIRATLLAVRATRPAPFLDRKVLAAWNGLAISALARAGFALEEPRFVDAAERSADFILEEMHRDGRLQRSWLDGVAQGPAFLEDHAFLVAGLLDLFEAAPDPRWLRAAIDLQAALDERFGDPDGGYFRTAADQTGLIAREKPARDGALPSGNSVAAWNLIRLHALTADPGHLTRLGALFSAFRGPLEQAPESLSELLLAVDAHLDQMREIVVVKPPGSDAAAMLAPLRRGFVPNRVLAVVEDGAVDSHTELTPLVARKRAERGEVTAYVCHDHVCDLPTTDPAIFASQLRAVRELPAPGGGG